MISKQTLIDNNFTHDVNTWLLKISEYRAIEARFIKVGEIKERLESKLFGINSTSKVRIDEQPMQFLIKKELFQSI